MKFVGIEFAQVASAPSLGNLEAGALASATSIRASVVSGGIARMTPTGGVTRLRRHHGG